MNGRPQSPRCPRCGGRLFLDSEFRGRRLFYFWECSLGCSRRWGLGSLPQTCLDSERLVEASLVSVS